LKGVTSLLGLIMLLTVDEIQLKEVRIILHTPKEAELTHPSWSAT
jgi:hypothetical protein